MPSVFTQAELQRLRAGDRVNYGGVQWQVTDYSTYNDDNGYATAEWLLKTTDARTYYLLREVDPDNPDTLVNWYLSEEISGDRVSTENLNDNLKFTMWRVIREGEQPYPHLRTLGRDYYFESQTDGTYNSDEGKASRTTWDYWDRDHLWNLAIEAWEDGDLHFYSTKKVDPQEFSEVTRLNLTSSSHNLSFDNQNQQKQQLEMKTVQIFMAVGLIIVGILLMMFGGW